MASAMKMAEEEEVRRMVANISSRTAAMNVAKRVGRPRDIFAPLNPCLKLDSPDRPEKILIIEPTLLGSRKKLTEVITSRLPPDSFQLVTMSPLKWYWRARAAAISVSQKIMQSHNFQVIFCTSALPLAEILIVRPDLANCHKIVYFHENQLNFPMRIARKRDFLYGFNEIMSCLAADTILFNSRYNMQTFLADAAYHLRVQPNNRTKGLEKDISKKCFVMYYPIELNMINKVISEVPEESVDDDKMLHIVWPHRWELDKNPESMCMVIHELIQENESFKISIFGEPADEKPEALKQLALVLQSRLVHNGHIDSRAEYYRHLKSADVVVSTAKHEFFGVSVMEAVACGCIPVVPRGLAYDELYSDVVSEMYEDDKAMFDTLTDLCKRKREGKPLPNYAHLARPFEASNWFENLHEMMYEPMRKVPPGEQAPNFSRRLESEKDLVESTSEEI